MLMRNPFAFKLRLAPAGSVWAERQCIPEFARIWRCRRYQVWSLIWRFTCYKDFNIYFFRGHSKRSREWTKLFQRCPKYRVYMPKPLPAVALSSSASAAGGGGGRAASPFGGMRPFPRRGGRSRRSYRSCHICTFRSRILVYRRSAQTEPAGASLNLGNYSIAALVKLCRTISQGSFEIQKCSKR